MGFCRASIMIAALLLCLPAARAEDAAPTCFQGLPAQRVAACTLIIDAKPPKPPQDRARALVSRCESHRLNAELDDAFGDCSLALTLDPSNPSAHNVRAMVRRAKGDAEGAIADSDTAVRTGQDTGPIRLADLYFGRALGYEMKGDWDRAIADIDRSIQLRPGDKKYRNARGFADLKKGDFPQAVQDCTAIIAADPNSPLALQNRGRAYFGMNNDAAALADFESALQLSPKLATSRLYRGLVLERQKQYARAADDVDTVLAHFPKDQIALDAHERIAAILAGKAAPAAPPPAATIARASTTATASDADDLFAIQRRQAAVTSRVALVIGNSAYQFASPLANPANDSNDVAAALRKVGFTVVEGHDLDWRGMVAKIREFAGTLGTADLALFFYAGHGIQVNGENYLIPVDAKLDTPGSLDLDAVNLRTILRPMEDAKRVDLVFLDACRDNPFTRSMSRSIGSSRSVSVSQGLAQIEGAAGEMIAYSTQPDNVAMDGAGRNSPFTTALLKYIDRPGLEIEQMMKLVRVDVMSATQQRQIPWGHSSLVGDVFLKPAN
jgi:tetratricopeptide (TPR) repeat protein